MINFFRNIRKNLILEKKALKYFKYAVGEIVLVVVGILIALQINNWNEGRKNAAKEAYILNEILNNLYEDAEQIEFNLKRREATQSAIENLLNIIDKSPIDEMGLEKNLADFLTFERFYPVNNAYEMLKSNGLIIDNKYLRTDISRYYDFEQKKVNQSIKDIEGVIIRIVQSENAIRSNLKDANTGTKLNPSVDLRDPSDPKFLILLHTELITFNDNHITSLERIIEFKNLNNRLSTKIKSELNKHRLKKYL